jgi:hypothetical protein
MSILKFLLLSLSLTSFALAGNEGGHGGDPYAYEFQMLGKALAKKLTSYEKNHSPILARWKLEANEFDATVDRVRVISKEPADMILNGEEVDGINFPDQNLIKVNRARWREANLQERLTLSLHEYLGIIGIERDQYLASNDLLGMITEILTKKDVSSFLIVQLFYGQCSVSPSLSEDSFCEPGSASFERANACALRKANDRCSAAGRASCLPFETKVETKLSKNMIGLKTCDVLTILK